MTRPKKGKPREPLSRERALQVATALADEKGLEALTMRALAQELGVEAMSLYHHVPNKNDILDGMVDLVFAEIDLPAGTGDWKGELRRRTHSARAALTRHPWAIGLMESRAAPGLATLRHHDAVLGSLRKGGFSLAQTAHAYSLLDAYLYGFVLQELQLPFDTEGGADAQQAVGALFAQLPAGAFPHMEEFTRDHVLKPGYSYGKEFDFGLELVLDSLEALRQRRR
jgi:AcrR family transcriptional regulator